MKLYADQFGNYYDDGPATSFGQVAYPFTQVLELQLYTTISFDKCTWTAEMQGASV